MQHKCYILSVALETLQLNISEISALFSFSSWRGMLMFVRLCSGLLTLIKSQFLCVFALQYAVEDAVNAALCRSTFSIRSALSHQQRSTSHTLSWKLILHNRCVFYLFSKTARMCVSEDSYVSFVQSFYSDLSSYPIMFLITVFLWIYPPFCVILATNDEK